MLTALFVSTTVSSSPAAPGQESPHAKVIDAPAASGVCGAPSIFASPSKISTHSPAGVLPLTMRVARSRSAPDPLLTETLKR